jgi:hypothetical protein
LIPKKEMQPGGNRAVVKPCFGRAFNIAVSARLPS